MEFSFGNSRPVESSIQDQGFDVGLCRKHVEDVAKKNMESLLLDLVKVEVGDKDIDPLEEGGLG